MIPRERGIRTRVAIKKFIADYAMEHHYPPTRREIAEGVGRTLSVVQFHLEVLRADGEVTYSDRVPRSIVVTS